MGSLNTNVDFPNIYREVCPYSAETEFSNTVKKFLEMPEMQPFFSAVQVNVQTLIAVTQGWGFDGTHPVTGFSSEVGIQLNGLFRTWLKDFSNCPPPPPSTSPQADVVGVVQETHAIEVDSSDNGDVQKPEDPINLWQVGATIVGAGLAAGGFWLASGFLIADDASGIGVADDEALAVTVPAATVATATTVEQVSKLAAGVAFAIGAVSPATSSTAEAADIPESSQNLETSETLPEYSVYEGYDPYIDPLGLGVSLE